MNDLKFAFRQLLKNPGFTAVAVLTLALGVGANTAIFSVVNTVLLRQLPYRNPERVVVVSELNLAKGGEQTAAATPSFIHWRQQSSSFEGLAAVTPANFNFISEGTAERLQAGMPSANFFDVLGVRPMLGRTFLPEEEKLGKHFVLILSERFWRRRFGADAGVIGRQVTLNGNVHTIIGVLPETFRFLQPVGMSGWPMGQTDPDVWRPYPYESVDEKNRDFRWLLVIGRLKQGVTVPSAEAELRAISRQIAKSFPDAGAWSVGVKQLHDQVTGHFKAMLLMLFGAVGIILLIACVNVANLLLARALSREKEFAIRLSLGATRKALVRQLITEGLLLSVLSGVLAILLTRWGVDLLLAVGPDTLHQWGAIRLDVRALAFALCLALGTGVLFSLAPVIQTLRTRVNESLKGESRGFSESSGHHRARRLLVVSEVTLAFVLVIAAGLLGRSFATLSRVNPGFQPDHLLALDISLADRSFGDPGKRIRFARQIRERISALPGVVSAATVYGLPFGSMVKDQLAFTVRGREPAIAGHPNITGYRQASPGYFETMRIPLLSGRTFTESDHTNTEPKVVINAAFALEYFSNEDSLGKSVLISDDPQPYQIVGVVGDARAQGLGAAPAPEIYQCQLQACEYYLSLVVRTTGDPSRMLELVRKEALAMDPGQPWYNARTLDHQIAQSITPQRFSLLLIGLFGSAALALAGLGIYGVMAYSVTQRRREIGIRMALGAQARDVLNMVIIQGMQWISAGLLLGLIASFPLMRLLRNQLYQVSAADPFTFVWASVFFVTIALIACWLPARRAANVDPMEAMRCE